MPPSFIPLLSAQSGSLAVADSQRKVLTTNMKLSTKKFWRNREIISEGTRLDQVFFSNKLVHLGNILIAANAKICSDTSSIVT